MKRYVLALSFLVLITAVADFGFAAKRRVVVETSVSGADSDKIVDGNFVKVTDFEKESKNLFGAWNKDPNDDTQGCRAEIAIPGYNGKGKCVKLTYDVDSPNVAFCGLWVRLNGEKFLDLSGYTKLFFWIKGDTKEGYTTKVKIELKDSKVSSDVILDNITDGWKLVELPLGNFTVIKDWKQMKEFVITFDSNVTQKSGAICVDNVYFGK